MGFEIRWKFNTRLRADEAPEGTHAYRREAFSSLTQQQVNTDRVQHKGKSKYTMTKSLSSCVKGLNDSDG